MTAPLVIVSGLSGSGKSTALRALEDLGYYCVDNLPIALLGAFGQQLASGGMDGAQTGAAVGIDVRNAQDPALFPATLDALRAGGVRTEVVYLTAERATLVARFSETRRRHPLAREGVALADAIAREEARLAPIAAIADHRVDTTRQNIYELRERMRALTGVPRAGMLVYLQSFAYRLGTPADADLVFDTRCLPNPYWSEGLRDYTGQDAPVVEHLRGQALARALEDDLVRFIETWLPHLRHGDRGSLHVALGCTGGRHRSVYMADALAARLRAAGHSVAVRHRDLGPPAGA